MFFKKKKYITINNPQKSRKNYDLTSHSGGAYT